MCQAGSLLSLLIVSTHVGLRTAGTCPSRIWRAVRGFFPGGAPKAFPLTAKVEGPRVKRYASPNDPTPTHAQAQVSWRGSTDITDEPTARSAGGMVGPDTDSRTGLGLLARWALAVSAVRRCPRTKNQNSRKIERLSHPGQATACPIGRGPDWELYFPPTF